MAKDKLFKKRVKSIQNQNLIGEIEGILPLQQRRELAVRALDVLKQRLAPRYTSRKLSQSDQDSLLLTHDV